MSTATLPISQHNDEIEQNLSNWQKKPLLRKIYHGFHEKIAAFVETKVPGLTVELGSGIGNIKEVIPNCLRTDLFPNPWLDQVENAYALSFRDASVANIILFDVFHHLRFPGTALAEFQRVLAPGGRVIIFDPYISLLGLIVYGLLHHEPIALNEKITWSAPKSWSPSSDAYYAAQGNATRVFWGKRFRQDLCDWQVVHRQRLACISYVASGGYSKPQLYPDSAYGLLRFVDSVFDTVPVLAATRALVVLEKSI